MFGVQKKKKQIRKIILDESDHEESNFTQEISNLPSQITVKAPLSFGDEENEDVFKIKKSIPHKKKSKTLKKNEREEVILHEEKVESNIQQTLQTGDIPDAQMIFAARKQRQNFREFSGNNTLYHPFEVVKNKVLSKSVTDTKSTSRIVREEDDDLSDTEEYGQNISTTTEIDDIENRYINMSQILENESKEKYSSKKELLKYLDKKEKQDMEKIGKSTENHDNNFRTHQISETSPKNQPGYDDSRNIDSEEEEFERWEQEQIKKGYNMPQLLDLPSQPGKNFYKAKDNNVKSTTATLINGKTLEGDSSTLTTFKTLKAKATALETKIPRFILSEIDQPIQRKTSLNSLLSPGSIIRKDIDKRIEDLKSKLVGLKGDLANTMEHISSNDEISEKLQGEKTTLQEENTFYQEFKEYVEALIDCHNEKIVVINSLENRIHNLGKQRATRQHSRKLQDVQDEITQYSLNQINGQEVLDISLNTSKLNDESKQRIIQRENRRKMRKTKKNDQNITHSTDEELDLDTNENYIAYNKQIAELLKQRDGLFDDVLEDYCDILFFMDRFGQWKCKYPKSYKEAYIDLYLATVITNIVRYHTLDWNLFSTDASINQCKFIDMPWFSKIMTQICNHKNSEIQNSDEGAPMNSNASDAMLIISNVIQNVFLPKITFLIQHVYDATSLNQTQKLILFMQDLSQFPFYYADNTKIQELYNVIKNKLIKTMEQFLHLPLYPAHILAVNVEVQNYRNRQFWFCIKIFENFMMWSSLFSQESMIEFLDGILNRYLIIGFQHSIISASLFDKCQKVWTIINSYFTHELKAGDQSKYSNFEYMPQFLPFYRYMVYLKQSINNMDIAMFSAHFGNYEKTYLITELDKMISQY